MEGSRPEDVPETRKVRAGGTAGTITPAEQFKLEYPLLPGFQNRQRNCLWRSGVYAMTFSYCVCRHSRTKLWQNLTATSGRWETRPFNRCCGSRAVGSGFESFFVGVILLDAQPVPKPTATAQPESRLRLTRSFQQPTQSVCSTRSSEVPLSDFLASSGHIL